MISIAYFTCRNQPMFNWWSDAVARQVKESGINPDDLDIMVIDYYGRENELGTIAEESCKKFGKFYSSFRVIKPKPTVWQGDHRKVTKRNYFAASNARNTAMIAMRGSYLICCDDISIPQPLWATNAMHAARTGYIVQGAYRKVYDIVVKDGLIESFRDHPAGHDPRWARGSDKGIVKSSPHLTYGCSFGVPLEYIIKTNGFDEDCDPIGGEDYLFGLRLNRLGVKFYYNRNMLTYESEELHHDPVNEIFLRVDKATPGNPLGHDSSHIMLGRLNNTSSCLALGNHYKMEDAREHYKKTGEFPPVKDISTHWVDYEPLENM